MTPEEREKMNELCERIKLEKDPEVIAQLGEELNELLERVTAPNRPGLD